MKSIIFHFVAFALICSTFWVPVLGIYYHHPWVTGFLFLLTLGGHGEMMNRKWYN